VASPLLYGRPLLRFWKALPFKAFNSWALVVYGNQAELTLNFCINYCSLRGKKFSVFEDGLSKPAVATMAEGISTSDLPYVLDSLFDSLTKKLYLMMITL